MLKPFTRDSVPLKGACQCDFERDYVRNARPYVVSYLNVHLRLIYLHEHRRTNSPLIRNYKSSKFVVDSRERQIYVNTYIT
jgi:hypothetical protein